MHNVEGRHFKTLSAAAVPATLSLRPDGGLLLSRMGEEQRRLPPTAVARISDKVGRIPRRVEFTDGSVFETSDNDGIDGLFRAGNTPTSLVHRMERFHPRLIILVIAAIMLVFATVRYAVPFGAGIAARTTPDAVASLIDSGIIQSVDRLLLSPTGLTGVRQQSLTSLFDEVAALSRSRDNLRLVFRRGGRLGPNAFALPGGTVILTDELVALADNDTQIQAVLAHEIGHVEDRHGLQQLYRALGLTVFIMLVAGDSGQIAEEIVAQGAAVLTLSYSRGFERDADETSVRLMTAIGKDGGALAEMLEKLQDAADRLPGRPSDGDGSSGEAGWLATHPATADRARAIREAAAQASAAASD